VYTEPSHHHEHKKIGHNWLDLSIAVAALLISLTTLVVAIVHSLTLEKMAEANTRLVEANSWPFVEYTTGHDVQANDSVWIGLANDGVGPAKIETAELRWNGVPQKNPVAFLKACCGYKEGTKGPTYEVVAGRVLRAGETIRFIVLPKSADNTNVWTRLNSARISRSLSVNICYCSVFDECWTDDVIRLTLKPQRVDQCVEPAIAYEIPEQQ
jgi:hypothetical protein